VWVYAPTVEFEIPQVVYSQFLIHLYDKNLHLKMITNWMLVAVNALIIVGTIAYAEQDTNEGEDPEDPGEELLMAAKDGDIQKVISFINDDPNMIDIVDSRNNTPLILAAGSWENNTEVIRTLIENGANVHAMNNKMRTAIFEAATRGHNIENVRMLISKGADVNGSFERRGENYNLLQWVAFRSREKDDTEIMKLLIENGSDVNGVLLPLLINDDFEFEEVFKLTKILIGKGIDVNEDSFWKPIHGAIYNFLSNYGYNDDGAEVPLYDFKTIKLLLENGADVNSKKAKGRHDKSRTPILSAALDLRFHSRGSNAELVEYLMDNGADITAVDDKGEGLTEWALKYENSKVIIGLINKGLIDGDTPTENCEDKRGERICEDTITWARRKRLTDILTALRNPNKGEEIESQWQIETTAKLVKIMEQLEKISNALHIE